MKRLLILIVIVVILGALYFWANSQGYLDRFNPEALYEARDDLKATIQERLLLAGVIFVLIYFITVALSIPGATLLTLTGGFIFGPVLGTLLVNLGASSGAVGIFLAARYFMGSKVQEKYGDKLEKFNREVEANGASYLLMLRFIPLFPFFLINLLSGFTTVKLSTFVWTTVFGILPGVLSMPIWDLQAALLRRAAPCSRRRLLWHSVCSQSSAWFRWSTGRSRRDRKEPKTRRLAMNQENSSCRAAFSLRSSSRVAASFCTAKSLCSSP